MVMKTRTVEIRYDTDSLDKVLRDAVENDAVDSLGRECFLAMLYGRQAEGDDRVTIYVNAVDNEVTFLHPNRITIGVIRRKGLDKEFWSHS